MGGRCGPQAQICGGQTLARAGIHTGYQRNERSHAWHALGLAENAARLLARVGPALQTCCPLRQRTKPPYRLRRLQLAATRRSGAQYAPADRQGAPLLHGYHADGALPAQQQVPILCRQLECTMGLCKGADSHLVPPAQRCAMRAACCTAAHGQGMWRSSQQQRLLCSLDSRFHRRTGSHIWLRRAW